MLNHDGDWASRSSDNEHHKHHLSKRQDTNRPRTFAVNRSEHEGKVALVLGRQAGPGAEQFSFGLVRASDEVSSVKELVRKVQDLRMRAEVLHQLRQKAAVKPLRLPAHNARELRDYSRNDGETDPSSRTRGLYTSRSMSRSNSDLSSPP